MTGSRGVASTVVNLFVCMVGLGLLAFPSAAGGAGVLLSAAFLAVFAALFAAGTLLLGRVTDLSGCSTYQGTAALYLGAKSGVAMQAVYILTGFLAVQNFLIVSTDAFLKLDVVAAHLNRAAVCACVAVLMLPFCFLRTLGALRFTSTIAMFGIFLVVACMYYDVAEKERAHPAPPLDYPAVLANATHTAAPGFALLPHSAGSVLQFPPLLVGAFVCQVNAIRGMVELKDRRDYTTVILVVAGFAAVFYSLFTIAGVWAYGAAASSDVLSELSGTQGHVAQVTNALACVLKAPFLVQPCRSMLFGLSGVEETALRRNLLTVAFVVLCYSIAFSVTDFGAAFAVLGGTCGTAIALIFPALIFLKFAQEPKVSDDPTENAALLPGSHGPAKAPAAPANLGLYRAAGCSLLAGGAAVLVCMVASLCV
eukprot:TRINITY_DN16213_c0_g1_i1.p1 TRINITY_DN16213_c0_g1~~TRINITY_DN16213_c0_g1_i1.p1  ORF type:complete len:424 (+),score=150.48 TRINITY_DN16213_c0_g1_i1:78-1349(+)